MIRSIPPSDGSNPNLGDAKKTVEREGFSPKVRDELYMNPLTLLIMRTGFYIVKLVAGCKDGRDDDEHFIAYNAHPGHPIDNDQYKKLLKSRTRTEARKRRFFVSIFSSTEPPRPKSPGSTS